MILDSQEEAHVKSSRRIEWLVRIAIGVLLVWLPPRPALGEAFRIIDQSASATGQGTAFAAQADDPSAIHFNPAGMTQLQGVQVSLGTLLIGGHVSFKNSAGATTHGNFGGALVSPPPSHAYLTASLGDLGVPLLKALTVGIGVNSPFGVLVEYPESLPVGRITASAALPLLDIKPTVAYKFNQYLSVGAGLDLYTLTGLLGQGHVEQKRVAGPEFGMPPLSDLGVPPGAFLEVNGADTAVGANLGFMLTPWRDFKGDPRLNIAFVYRSRATLNLAGKLLVNGAPVADAATAIHLPRILSGGIAVWPIRDDAHKWKVEVDLDYADWSSFDNLDLKLTNIRSPPSPVTSTTLPFPRDYGGAYVVMVGTEYSWLRGSLLPDWNIAVRGGYVFSDTPVPESKFDPMVPDSDYHAISVGLGFLCQRRGRFLGVIPCGRLSAKAFGVDLAYQVLLYDSRAIRTNDDPRLNGQWDTAIHVGAMSFRVNF